MLSISYLKLLKFLVFRPWTSEIFADASSSSLQKAYWNFEHLKNFSKPIIFIVVFNSWIYMEFNMVFDTSLNISKA
jgi:hypothetical protein